MGDWIVSQFLGRELPELLRAPGRPVAVMTVGKVTNLRRCNSSLSQLVLETENDNTIAAVHYHLLETCSSPSERANVYKQLSFFSCFS